jgi:hypothetical protein
MLQTLTKSGVEYSIGRVRVRDVAVSTQDFGVVAKELETQQLVESLLRSDEEGFAVALRSVLIEQQRKSRGGESAFISRLRARLIKGGELALGIGPSNNNNNNSWTEIVDAGDGVVVNENDLSYSANVSHPLITFKSALDGENSSHDNGEEFEEVFSGGGGDDSNDEFQSVGDGDDDDDMESSSHNSNNKKKKKLVLV